MSTTVLDVTDATFDEEMVAAASPVVVEFSAEWCPPCRAMAPVLDDLAAEYDGSLRFVRVDSDAHPDLARRYDVVSVPTFLVMAGGELRHRMVGARSRGRFRAEIEAALSR
ncbi:MAG: thioredoxin family protein [Acidimicrobiales bacterium]